MSAPIHPTKGARPVAVRWYDCTWSLSVDPEEQPQKPIPQVGKPLRRKLRVPKLRLGRKPVTTSRRFSQSGRFLRHRR